MRGPHGGAGRTAALLFAVAFTVVLAGCATTSSLPGHGGSTDSRQLAVVRHWAAALRAGNLTRAAAFFHVPSLFDNGALDTITIHSMADAKAANSTLGCGAIVISAVRRGRFIDVLFRLTARAGRGGGRQACGTGIGQTARTEFLIRDGQILDWLRAPSLPGDPGGPGSPGGGNGGGGSSQGGGGSLPA